MGVSVDRGAGRAVDAQFAHFLFFFLLFADRQ